MTNIGNLEMDIEETGTLTPNKVWTDKDVWAAREEASHKEWEKMPDEKRKVVLDMVERAMCRLLEHLDQWVPYSLEIAKGDHIDVRFRMIWTVLEEELQQREEITRRKITQARDETRQILIDAGEDLGDED